MRRLISLNDSNWFIGAVPPQPNGAVNDFAQVQGWLPARVPGDVRDDLLRAGKIPDPFLGFNNKAGQWVDDRDWWYRRDIELETDESTRTFLLFEGIDYQSVVFWNGVELGRHVGMFSRQIYEIPRALLSSGRHQLAVRVSGGNQLPRLKLGARERLQRALLNRLIPMPSHASHFPDRYATLKCAMSFGWDFAPRLLTCGIWDEAWLVQTRKVFLRDIWVQGVPDGRVRVTLDLNVGAYVGDMPQRLHAILRVAGKNFDAPTQVFRFDFEYRRLAGTSLSDAETKSPTFMLQLAAPQLWQPWDRGEPNLYELQVTLADDSGELDAATTTFGLRSIELAPNPGAAPSDAPWTFVINGVPEFIRGANWVPADAIPARVTRDDYAALLQLAREANINLLRVWGGGLREKRAFYDLCDELGILVWQEFPFCGAGVDYFPRDRAFLELVEQECRAIVARLRNHPSLVLWCGGNEFFPRWNRHIIETIRYAVAREDGTRPFKPASPSPGESHNWQVWHAFANTRDYRKDAALFFGEFGLQAPPDVETLKRFLPDDALFPPSAAWEYHNAQLEKLWRYARPLLGAQGGEGGAGWPHAPTLNAFVTASQMAQLRGLQVAIEHARRNKPRVSGCLFWQFNEPWYSICWSVVDYLRRPKRAYAKIQELYNPVCVSFDYPLVARRAGDELRGQVWLINDTRQMVSGRLRVWHNHNQVLDLTASVEADTGQVVASLVLTLAKGANDLRFEFVAGEIIATNEYDLNYCDHGEIHLCAGLLNRLSTCLRVSS